jgi:hypothetical protein
MSDLALNLTQLPGGGQFPFVETYPSQDGTLAATNLTADSVYVARVRVMKQVTITNMHIYIGAALGNIDLGIYTGTLSGGLTRVASTGSTAAAGASALQTIALTAAYTLQPGIDYWFAFGSTSGGATLTVARSAGVVALVLTSDTLAVTAIKAAAWSSGLPATLSSLTATSNTVWVRGS